MGYTFDKSKKFINPYNFISTGNPERSNIEDNKNEPLVSGVLKCKLFIKTPITIPDTSEVSTEKGHNTFPFMKNPNGDYMIPGSSIRGVIRSVYETATDSCFSTTDEKQRITKRAKMNEAGKPGLLMYDNNKNQWELHEAERFLIIMDDVEYKFFGGKNEYKNKGFTSYKRKQLRQYDYGDEVYFDSDDKVYQSIKLDKRTNKERRVPLGAIVKSFSKEKKNYNKEGYLYIGEVPPARNNRSQTTKHFESIFALKKGENVVKVLSDKDINVLELVYKTYNDSTINRFLDKNGWYKGVIKALNDHKSVPIWYKQNGEDVVLSFASIGRVAFKKDMNDLLKDKVKCSDRKNACKACQLFGLVGIDGKTLGSTSRVRITDLIIKKPMVNSNTVTLKELSTPRISYLPFYATNTNASRDRVDTYDMHGVSIRGRKFYWHSNSEEYGTDVKTERNSTVEIISANEEYDKGFDFEIYYDAITEEQLAQLKWVITLGDNKYDSLLCHKIGHGKPLGLGSIKIVIDKEVSRGFSEEEGYSITSCNDVIVDEVDIKHKEELETILNMNTTNDKDVCYPYVVGYREGTNDNQKAAHQWFTYNAQKNNPGVTLPSIIDATKEPGMLHPIKTDNGNYHGRYSNNSNYQGKSGYKGKKYNNHKNG